MKTVTAAVVDSDPTKYEEQHVHAVYDQIASHFSSTRYKVRRSSLGDRHDLTDTITSHGPLSPAFLLRYPQAGLALILGQETENTCTYLPIGQAVS